MTKIKDGFWKLWGWFLDGVDYVADKISKYPKVTLGLFIAYVMARQ